MGTRASWQAPPGRCNRRVAAADLPGEDQALPHLPGFRAHHLHSDHYLQRGLRQVYRQYARRPPGLDPSGPGANPSYGAEQSGLIASLNSVAKLPYQYALDGISNTQTINPGALGHSDRERTENLVNILDGYFSRGAHHLNVNVFGKEMLLDAMEHPEKPEYQNFTIRVSGYAVKFIDLTREQQLDVISRTCHETL